MNNNTPKEQYEIPCMEITVFETEDIAYERMRSERNAATDGQDNFVYSDDYLEALAVYRKIAEWMPSQGIILFHGSVIAVDGKAYLFTAKVVQESPHIPNSGGSTSVKGLS